MNAWVPNYDLFFPWHSPALVAHLHLSPQVQVAGASGPLEQMRASPRSSKWEKGDVFVFWKPTVGTLTAQGVHPVVPGKGVQHHV